MVGSSLREIIVEVILSIALGVGQHRQKSRTCFPGDFALVIEMAHGVAAFLVLVQNLSDQLPFSQFRMIGFNVLIGDIDPESQGPCPFGFSLLNFQRSADGVRCRLACEGAVLIPSVLLKIAVS